MGADADHELSSIKSQLYKQSGPKVLEIGPGSFPAFARMEESDLQTYIALEPNPYLHSDLYNKGVEYGFTVSYAPDMVAGKHNMVIVNGTLDDDAVPSSVTDNAPYDTVISSLVLCSVDNPEANVKRIQSLLKPGGRLIFIEHIHYNLKLNPDKAFWAHVQKFIDPIWNFWEWQLPSYSQHRYTHPGYGGMGSSEHRAHPA